MAEHDRTVLHAQGAGSAYVFQVAPAQEFGAHHVHQAHPREQQHDPQQPPEVGLHETGKDDQQVQHRQSGPDFQEALPGQIHPAAVETLQGPGDHADDRAEHGQGQGEQHRNAETVDHPGQHVAALVVGAQQVVRRGRGRGRDFQVVVDALVAVGNRRPQHPGVLGLEQFADVRALVVGFQRKFAAEGGFRVALERREVPVVVVMHRQRLVVGDQLGAEACAKQDQEQPQRPPATLVGLEQFEAAAIERGQVHLNAPGFRSRCADRQRCR
ncbi:hypothetical protein D9M71_525860 [compost metagenome]